MMTDTIRNAMWQAMAESSILMVRLNAGEEHAAPMVAQLAPDADGKFWFFTRRGNRIAPGGPAMAQFVARDHRLFCCIAGTLTQESDPAIIDKYWTASVAAWYEAGRTDPDMLMMRFDLKSAEIWYPDNSLKGLFRLMSGKGHDESLHQTVSLERG